MIRIIKTPENIEKMKLLDKMEEEIRIYGKLLPRNIHKITDSLIEIENPTKKFVKNILYGRYKYNHVNVIYKVPHYNDELQKLINIKNKYILENWKKSNIIRERNLDLSKQKNSNPSALERIFLTPNKENIFDFFVDKTTGRNIGKVIIKKKRLGHSSNLDSDNESDRIKQIFK